jgi:hypothetical protein
MGGTGRETLIDWLLVDMRERERLTLVERGSARSEKTSLRVALEFRVGARISGMRQGL